MVFLTLVSKKFSYRSFFRTSLHILTRLFLYIHFLLYPLLSPFSFKISSISSLQAKCILYTYISPFHCLSTFPPPIRARSYPSGLGCRSINLFRLCRDLRSDPISQLSYTMSYSYVYWEIKSPAQNHPVLYVRTNIRF